MRIRFALLLTAQVFLCEAVWSQWVQVTGLNAGGYEDVVSNQSGDMTAIMKHRKMAVSTDIGQSWRYFAETPEQYSSMGIVEYSAAGDLYYYGAHLWKYSSGIWYDLIEGTELSNAVITAYSVLSHDTIAAITYHTQLYLTYNGGRTWTYTHDLPPSVWSGRDPIAFNANGELEYRVEDGILNSVDQGKTWTRLGEKTNIEWFYQDKRAMSRDSEDNIYCVADSGLAFYHREKDDWKYIKRVPRNYRMESIYCASSDVLYIAYSTSAAEVPLVMEKTSDNGETWEIVQTWSEAYSPEKIVYAQGDQVVAYHRSSSMFRTSDNGRTWVKSMSQIHDIGPALVCINQGRVFLYQLFERYYASSEGSEWEYFIVWPPRPAAEILFLDNGTLVRTDAAEISWSEDMTRSWFVDNPASNDVTRGPDSTVVMAAIAGKIMHFGHKVSFIDLIAHFDAKKIGMNRNHRILGANERGEFILVDVNGENAHTGYESGLVGDLHDVMLTDNNVLLVQMGTGMMRSTDEGSSWTKATLSDTVHIEYMEQASNGAIFGLSADAKVYASSDLGATWEALPLPDNRMEVVDIACSESYVYATTNWFGCWKYPLAGLASVKMIQTPDELTVYPSPISDGMWLTIQGIDVAHPAIICIYDIMGRLRKKIENCTPKPTSISVSLRDLKLSTGNYIVTVRQEDGLRKGAFVVVR